MLWRNALLREASWSSPWRGSIDLIQGVRVHASSAPPLHLGVRCARCVPAASTGRQRLRRICTSAGQRVSKRLIPLKAVAPVRIRSGLQPNTSATRPLTWTNEGQRPCRVSDRVRSDPAVGEHVCPFRARVLVGDGGLTAVRSCVSQVTSHHKRQWCALSCRSPSGDRHPIVAADRFFDLRGRGILGGSTLGSTLVSWSRTWVRVGRSARAPLAVSLVVQEVIAHRAGDLADDVTVVCLD